MMPTMDLSVSSDLSGSLCKVARNPNRLCMYGASVPATINTISLERDTFPRTLQSENNPGICLKNTFIQTVDIVEHIKSTLIPCTATQCRSLLEKLHNNR